MRSTNSAQIKSAFSSAQSKMPTYAPSAKTGGYNMATKIGMAMRPTLSANKARGTSASHSYSTVRGAY